MFLNNFYYKKILCNFCLNYKFSNFNFLILGNNSFICFLCLKYLNKLIFNKLNKINIKKIKNFKKMKKSNLDSFYYYKNYNECFKEYNYLKNLFINVYNINLKNNLNNFDKYFDFYEFSNFDEYNLDYKNLSINFENYINDYNDEYYYYYYYYSNNFEEYNITYNFNDFYNFEVFYENFDINFYDNFFEYYCYDLENEFLNNYNILNFLFNENIFYLYKRYDYIFYFYLFLRFNSFSYIFDYCNKNLISNNFYEDNFFFYNFKFYKMKYNFKNDDFYREYKNKYINSDDLESDGEFYYDYDSDNFDYEKEEIFYDNKYYKDPNYDEILNEYEQYKFNSLKYRNDEKTSRKIYKEYYSGKYKYINFRKFLNDFITPDVIYKYLDKSISGQINAKKILSVSLYNHLKLIKFNFKHNFNLNKSNILIIGPSGSGKTYLIQNLVKILNIPYVIVDSTSFTEAGYVGDDVENIIQRLYENSDFDPDKTEMGLVYIDEFDKLAKKNTNNKDISGEGVQQSLLKLIEGTECLVFSDYYNDIINTKNILFICGGAFSGIEEFIKSRLNKNNIGFKKNIREIKDYNTLIKNLKTEDLFKFGIIPELVGRLPLIIKLEELDIKSLSNILLKGENSIVSNYNDIIKPEGIKLYIDEIASNIISKRAFEDKIGARGLKSIIDNILLDIFFNINFLKNLKLILIYKNINKPILIFKSLKKIEFDIS